MTDTIAPAIYRRYSIAFDVGRRMSWWRRKLEEAHVSALMHRSGAAFVRGGDILWWHDFERRLVVGEVVFDSGTWTGRAA